MPELDKFNLKINIIPNGLEKYISFIINNQQNFIVSFKFVRSSLNSSVKNLNKIDFKYLIQKFDNNILDLLKQKGFYPYEYMNDFEKSKEGFPSKEKFSSSLTYRKTDDKEYEPVLNVSKKFEMKTIRD